MQMETTITLNPKPVIWGLGFGGLGLKCPTDMGALLGRSGRYNPSLRSFSLYGLMGVW